MADFTGIAATGSSIVRYLELCFRERDPITGERTDVSEEDPREEGPSPVNVVLVRTEDLNREASSFISPPALTLFLYRIDFNKSMRAAWSAIGHDNGDSHLPIDMHFLLIPWAGNAEHEYRILGRAMQCLDNVPILSGPLLDPNPIASNDWAAGDSIQIYLEDLSTEDLMRIFDSLPVDYKLSVPYVTRTIVIDGRDARPDLPVSKASTRIRAGMSK